MHPIFCAYLIIFLGLLNLDIITSTPPLDYLCVICNSNRFHSFIFKLCIMIVNMLKMCTGDAGPEQSLVLLNLYHKGVPCPCFPSQATRVGSFHSNFIILESYLVYSFFLLILLKRIMILYFWGLIIL